jgi:hypothetical protein
MPLEAFACNVLFVIIHSMEETVCCSVHELVSAPSNGVELCWFVLEKVNPFLIRFN